MSNIAKITPNQMNDNIDECGRRLDAIEAIATAFSISNDAGSSNDITVFRPELLVHVWDGIALLAKDAQQLLLAK